MDDLPLALELNSASKRDILIPWITSLPWLYFITITYRQPRTMESFYREAQRIEDTTRSPMGFLAPEEHKTGRLHVHGLLGGGNGPSLAIQAYTWEALFRRFGRADVKIMTEKKGAVYYCTKYVAKELTDYWIWG